MIYLMYSFLNLVPYRNQTGDVSLAYYPKMNNLYVGQNIPEIASICYGTLMEAENREQEIVMSLVNFISRDLNG